MKYFVIATHWVSDAKAPVKYIAGEFSDYVNASLFQRAYNDYYKADAVVVNSFDILNQ